MEVNEATFCDFDSFGFPADRLENTRVNTSSFDQLSVATRNILELKKKIFALQDVHQDYAEKCSENEKLRNDLERVKKQLLAQTRACTMLKKQVQMVVDGSAARAIQDLKKDNETKTKEFEEAKNSLVVMQGLLTQMKGSLDEAEKQKNEACTSLDLKNDLVAELKAKNVALEKQLTDLRQRKESERKDSRRTSAAVKRVGVLERQLERCKAQRMDIAEELSRTQSHYGLAEHRLKDAHAENKKLRDALEDLRHQLVTGTVPYRLITSEVCRSPASIETSPNLEPTCIGNQPQTSLSLELEVSEDDSLSSVASSPAVEKVCVKLPPPAPRAKRKAAVRSRGKSKESSKPSLPAPRAKRKAVDSPSKCGTDSKPDSTAVAISPCKRRPDYLPRLSDSEGESDSGRWQADVDDLPLVDCISPPPPPVAVLEESCQKSPIPASPTLGKSAELPPQSRCFQSSKPPSVPSCKRPLSYLLDLSDSDSDCDLESEKHDSKGEDLQAIRSCGKSPPVSPQAKRKHVESPSKSSCLLSSQAPPCNDFHDYLPEVSDSEDESDSETQLPSVVASSPVTIVEESCAKSPLPVCHIERKCMKSPSDSRCTDCPPTLAVSEGGVATENREGGDKALSPVDLSPVAAIEERCPSPLANALLPEREVKSPLETDCSPSSQALTASSSKSTVARCPELPKSDGEIDTEGYASSSDDEDAGLVIALDVAKDGKETGNAMEATDRKERVVRSVPPSPLPLGLIENPLSPLASPPPCSQSARYEEVERIFLQWQWLHELTPLGGPISDVAAPKKKKHVLP